jgi:hypothetical protein
VAKSSQPLPGLEPPIFQLVAQSYTTELSQLSDGQNSAEQDLTAITVLYQLLLDRLHSNTSEFKMWHVSWETLTWDKTGFQPTILMFEKSENLRLGPPGLTPPELGLMIFK